MIDLDALEQLPNDLFASMQPEDRALVLAAAAELRAARKVVEAARVEADWYSMNDQARPAQLADALDEYDAQAKQS